MSILMMIRFSIIIIIIIFTTYNVYDKYSNMSDEAPEYEQQPGTGADTSWTDGGITHTLANLMSISKLLPQKFDPQIFADLLIDAERDPQRVQAADINEPILIGYRDNKPIKILDGQHRVANAINQGEKIPVRVIDLDQHEEVGQFFDPQQDENV